MSNFGYLTSSGKKVLVLSTDNYFVKDGVYKFNPKMLPAAHLHTQELAKVAIKNGDNDVIIIDNTHTQKWEAKPYVEAAVIDGRYLIEFREPSTQWKKDPIILAKKNTHGVPENAIRRMLTRWESKFTVASVLKAKKL